MTAANAVRMHLSVPQQYTKPTVSCRGDAIIILVHQSWMSCLVETRCVPGFTLHDSLSHAEVEAALLQCEELGLGWQCVLVQVLAKPALGARALCLPRPRTSAVNDETGLSFPQLLDYVSLTNYKNLWKHQYKQFLGNKHGKKQDEKSLATRDATDVLKDTLLRLYGCPLVSLVSDAASDALRCGGTVQAHPNLLPAACVVETLDSLLVLHPLSSHVVLRDLVTFSPSVFHRDVSKALFVTYQMVQALRDSHDRALILGDVRLDDIYVSNDLFIQVVPRVSCNLFLVAPEEVAGGEVPRSPVDASLAALTQQWARGDLSNLEYLLHLNAAAGRSCGNPGCHFVLPWVSDLSTRASGAWRDLTRSKFRLNKGDRQLDLTYDHAPPNQAPHHVTDVLSEITYYVYLARRTPQAVLRRYVRPNWVPAEYPASIQRLYAWTPDECIPELYTDPSIFKSVHEDLGDLELPPWAPTPEEFIAAHREQLESRRVSDKLHHWIDLTFGCKLTGAAAVKAKNVCLRLANAQTSLASSGIVQVFSHPHPRRQAPLPGFSKQPPKARRVRTRTDEDDGPHSSEADDDDDVDSKASPLLLHRFLSISRTSLLAPFQSSSDETVARSSRGRDGPGNSDNPLALLNSVETAFAFHLRTFQCAPAQPANVASGPPGALLKRLVAATRLQEMRVLGCLVTELFLYGSVRLQPTQSLDDRIAACLRLLSHDSLPLCVRPALKLLLEPNAPCPVTPTGLPPPSAHQILQPLLSGFILPFPPSMPALYSAVARVKTVQRQCVDGEDVLVRVRLCVRALTAVLNAQTVELAYPFVLELVRDEATPPACVASLLDQVLSYLGVERGNQLFLDTLLGLYERPIDQLVFLYRRQFLLILLVRCGLKAFLHHVIALVVEAVGCNPARSNHAHPDGVVGDEDESSPEAEERPAVPVTVTEPEVGVFAFDREDTPSDGAHESLQSLMEQLTGTSDDEEVDPAPYVSRPTHIHAAPLRRWPVPSLDTDVTNSNEDEDLPPESAPSQEHSQLLREVALDSVLWLSRRLGPVLTAKHVTRNLLKVLTRCYTGPAALAPATITAVDELAHWKLSIARHKVMGDEDAGLVLTALGQLVDLYGEQLVLVQLLPFMADLIAISKRKLSLGVEGGVVGALALLKVVLVRLSDTTLMDNLQDVVLADIVHPLVRLMVSTRHAFPSGPAGRLALATKLLDTLYLLALHIGAEMTRVHLAVPSLQRFFLAFDKAAGLRLELEDAERDSHAETREELRRVFGPGLAHAAYLAFLRLLGEDTMQTAVVNHDLVRGLCLMHENQQDPAKRPKGAARGTLTELLAGGGAEQIDGASGSFGSSVAIVGNKIELQEDWVEIPRVTASGATGTAATPTVPCADNSRHVRGNWLAYWEHEIGRNDKDTRFNFKQIGLQTLQGHSHAVRCLELLDNENSLVSGSRDKTVKLWSLRSQGDGSGVSACQWTYTGHRKSLVGVAYLPGPRLVASCDASLHLWDPFVGRCVAVVDGKAACSALKALDATLLVGTADGSLRVVDARSAANVKELKVTWAPGSVVRCVCASADGAWVAVGQSSGLLTVLELSTGLVMASWKAHEAEVLQLLAVDSSTLVSSSLDQTVCVWNIHDGKLKFQLKGATEPVHCLKVHGAELISATTANRIGVHTGIDPHAGFSSTKLRSDTFKGVLTAMAVLPLNSQLLLGADNGHITLLC